MVNVSQLGPASQEEGRPMKARDINNVIRYTMWSVYRRVAEPTEPAADLATSALQAVAKATDGADVVIRGWYDVAGLRADADLMVWWHAPTSTALQDAYHALRRSELGRHLEPVWSQLALHRPAEFNKGHIPAFMADEEPGGYLCVYPFVRSYEWYLLPEQERRTMLAEHGMLARPYPDVRAHTAASFAPGGDEGARRAPPPRPNPRPMPPEHGMLARPYPDVRANTVSSFALGDYEWMLAFEAPEPPRHGARRAAAPARR